MSRLSNAIEKTPEVQGNGKIGMGAIKGEYRSKIIVPNTRLLTCTLDIDGSVKNLYPNDNRWDYALEYNDEVFFVEFHPAETSAVAKMLVKLEWLKGWLTTKAPKINELKTTTHNPYHWIGSGSFNIIKTSSQYRKLAVAGMIPRSQWNYNLLK